jgi:hypothetical protein
LWLYDIYSVNILRDKFHYFYNFSDVFLRQSYI